MSNKSEQYRHNVYCFAFLAVSAFSINIIMNHVENITLIMLVLGTGFMLWLLLSFYPAAVLPVFIASWGITHAILSSDTLSLGMFLEQPITISRALGALVIISVAMNLLFSKNNPSFLVNPAVRTYLIFAIWITIVAWLRSDFLNGINFWIRFMSEFMIFIAFYKLGVCSKAPHRIPMLMAATGCIGSLIAIAQFAGLDLIKEIYDQFGKDIVRVSATEGIARASGILGGTFVSSAILMISLGHVLALWEKISNKLQRWVVLSAIALILLGILVTLTRTTILGAIALITILVILKRRMRGKSLAPAIIVVTLLVLIIAIADLIITEGSLQRRVFSDLEDFSNGRFPMWQIMLSEFSRLGPLGWLMGGGIGFSEIASTISEIGAIVRVVHHQYLWLLTETGLIGLSLYLVFLVQIIRQLYAWIKNNLHINKVDLPAYWALVIVVTLIFANSWSYTGNAAFSWFYMSTVGFALGLTCNPSISSSKVDSQIKE